MMYLLTSPKVGNGYLGGWKTLEEAQRDALPLFVDLLEDGDAIFLREMIQIQRTYMLAQVSIDISLAQIQIAGNV